MGKNKLYLDIAFGMIEEAEGLLTESSVPSSIEDGIRDIIRSTVKDMGLDPKTSDGEEEPEEKEDDVETPEEGEDGQDNEVDQDNDDSDDEPNNPDETDEDDSEDLDDAEEDEPEGKVVDPEEQEIDDEGTSIQIKSIKNPEGFRKELADLVAKYQGVIDMDQKV